MKHAILAALLLAACADPAAPSRASLGEATTAELEAEIQATVSASRWAKIGLLAERESDGRRLQADSTALVERYLSASTAKPIAVAVILDQVAQGHLSLHSRAVDLLPAYAAHVTGHQGDVELWHLLSFTAGITQGPNCAMVNWQTPWADYLDCVGTLPTYNNPDFIPGENFAYNSRQLDIAGAMAVAVSGQSDWSHIFDAWRFAGAGQGLFPGAFWYPGLLPAASQQLEITRPEYLDFMRAMEDCTILPQPLCAQATEDQIPLNPTHNSTTYPQLGEDWHFGFAGFWMVCESPEWSCPMHDRVGYVGVNGIYGQTDRVHHYRVITTYPQGATEGWAGLELVRSVEPLLRLWAAAEDGGDQ